MKTIGIPRAGYYYEYYPFFKAFFEKLGFEVVLSPRSNQKIINQGLKAADSGMCLPSKVFWGHCLWLDDHKLDFISVPRWVSSHRKVSYKKEDEFFCPYFTGFSDILKSSNFQTPIIDLDLKIDDDHFDIENWRRELLDNLGKFTTHEGLKYAVKAARDVQKKYKDLLTKGYDLETSIDLVVGEASDEPEPILSNKKVLVMGRSYLIGDSFVNLDLLEKIKKAGYYPVIIENIDSDELEKEYKKYGKEKLSHWSQVNDALAAVSYWQDRELIGIIHLEAFPCGPDFLIHDLFIKRVNRKIPLTKIVIDENSGEAGVVTRLDAFFDMIK